MKGNTELAKFIAMLSLSCDNCPMFSECVRDCSETCIKTLNSYLNRSWNRK